MDIRGTCQDLLRAGNYYVDMTFLHVERVGEERADGVNHEQHSVPMAEVAEKLRVIMDTG